MNEQKLYSITLDYKDDLDEDEFADLDVFAQDVSDSITKPELSSEVKSVNFGAVTICGLAAIVFIGRAIWIWRSDNISVTEGAKSAGTAASYLAIGVTLPLRSRSLSHSEPVRRLLAVREHYADQKEDKIRFYMRLASLMVPLAVVAGAVAPVISWHQLMHEKPDGDGLFAQSALISSCFACWVVWFLGMLIFGPAKVEEAMLDASTVAIKGLISDMSINYEFADIDWERMARKHRTVDNLLLQVWDANCVGGQWSFRVFVSFVVSVALCALAVGHPNMSMRVTYYVVGAIFAAGGSALLFRVSFVTSMCIGTDGNQKTIITTAWRFVGRIAGKNEEALSPLQTVAYQTFLTYLQLSTMGIKLLGVLITPSTVVNVAGKMLLYVPVTLTVLGRLLYPELD